MDDLDRGGEPGAIVPDDSSADTKPENPVVPTPHGFRLGLVALIEKAATTPTEDGLAYIKNADESMPARRVRRSKFNGAVRQAGETMPFVQEGESHTGEYPLLLECDWSQAVVRYYMQPPSLDLDYVNKNGKRVRTRSTPDCLVELADGRAAIVEMVSEQEAQNESASGNPRFRLDDSTGRYVDAPMAERCRPLGIASVLLTTGDVNPTLIENYLFLGKGVRSDWQATAGTEKFLEFVRNSLVVTYQQATHAQNGWDADDVIGAIAHGLVYVDLRRERLGHFGTARIFASAEHHGMSEAVPVAVPAIHDSDSGPGTFKPFDLSVRGDAAINEAFRRFEIIKPVLRGEATRRSLDKEGRRWLKKFRLAVAEHGAGFVGLIPQYDQRGFRGSHLGEDAEKIISALVKLRATDRNVSPDLVSYGQLRTQCKNAGVTPPSKQTYHKRLKAARAEAANIKAQHGDEAAYQTAPAAPLTPSAISRVASRVWQLGLIDHTPLPIRLLEAVYGTRIEGASPHLTYMRDSATDEAIGMYISWCRPSEVSIMGALWDCYKNFRRLPEALLMDGEKPHDSIIVEQLLGSMEMDKMARRFLCPRDGQDVERDFKLMMHGLLAYLQGNYVLRQDPREWPRGWNPAQFADRTLGSLWLACRKFLFHYCNRELPRAALGGLTPHQAREASLRVHGNRGFRVHSDPVQARHILLPRVSKGVLGLTRSNGVRPFAQAYVPPSPIDPVFYGTDVPVRFDPLDIRYVIARIGNRWTELHHRHRHRFDGLSPDELAAVSVEIRETYRRHEQESPERAEKHAAMLEDIFKVSKDPLADMAKSREQEPESPPPVDESVWDRAKKGGYAPAKSYAEEAA